MFSCQPHFSPVSALGAGKSSICSGSGRTRPMAIPPPPSTHAHGATDAEIAHILSPTDASPPQSPRRLTNHPLPCTSPARLRHCPRAKASRFCEVSRGFRVLTHTGCDLNTQPSTLNPHPSTLIPQPSTLNPHPSTLNPQPSTLTPKP